MIFYRKPTHTDQYLHWDSHPSITNKYSIYNTLSLWTKYVCSNQQLLEQENKHIQTALCRCNYPDWAFHRLQTKLENQLNEKQCHKNTNLHRNNNRNHNTFLVIPYSKGLGGGFRNICGKVGVQIYFKDANRVKDLLVAPKDKANIIQKREVIYR